MYFPNTYNCIPLSVLVNLVIRLCTGSYIFTFIWCAFSGSSNRDIYIYIGLYCGLGFYWVVLSFIYFVVLRKLTCIIKIALFCSLIKRSS